MTQSFDLTSVDVILSSFISRPGSNFVLSIYSNDDSNNPGIDLYDLSTNVVGTGQLEFHGIGFVPPPAGTTYWLDLYASNPASPTGNTVHWAGEFTQASHALPVGAGVTDLGQLRSVGDGNPPTGTPNITERRTGFQLNGVAVPEPSSLVLCAIGFIGLAAWGVRRR